MRELIEHDAIASGILERFKQDIQNYFLGRAIGWLWLKKHGTLMNYDNLRDRP